MTLSSATNASALLVIEGVGPTTVATQTVAVSPGQSVLVMVAVPRYFLMSGVNDPPGAGMGATWTIAVGSATFTVKESMDSTSVLSSDNNPILEQQFGVFNWTRLVTPAPSASVTVSVSVTSNSNTQCGIAASDASLIAQVQ